MPDLTVFLVALVLNGAHVDLVAIDKYATRAQCEKDRAEVALAVASRKGLSPDGYQVLKLDCRIGGTRA